MDAERGPYRDRLEVLATDGLVEGCLDAWAAQRSADSLGPWRRVYSKLRPQRSPWAVLVYEGERGPTVQVRLLDGVSPAGGLGPIEILSCTEDPALPGLPAVLKALDSPRVVRYHPGGRCTVRGSVDGGDRYVKVLSETADDQPEVRARWDASRTGVLSFAVAEPHGWDARTLSSWYGVVPGEPAIATLRGARGTEMARQVGASLGELASAPLDPVASVDAAAQLARTKRAMARAAAAAPALAPGFRTAGEALARIHERLALRPLVPTHGAAHLGQWLLDDTGRLGLVDFDRFARGEPEYDVATFVVEASASGEQPAEIEDAVISGYHSVAPELDVERLALYVMHKRLARVARTACALRPDAEERAAPLLEELQSPLSRLAARRTG